MITQEWQFIILVVGWLIGLIPAIMAWNDDIYSIVAIIIMIFLVILSLPLMKATIKALCLII